MMNQHWLRKFKKKGNRLKSIAFFIFIAFSLTHHYYGRISVTKISEEIFMKLQTLVEYSLLIFLTGLYFAYLGFQANGLPFLIGVIVLYFISSYATKKVLSKYNMIEKKVSIFAGVITIIVAVFITMFLLNLLVL